MDIEGQIKETIRKYKLLKKSDRIVVALSGGKDSTSIIYILKNLGYDVHGLMIDLYLGEWSEIHKRNMKKFCLGNDVPLTIVDLKEELGQGICFIKAVLKKRKGLTGCSVCGTVKRWILNKWARKLGGDVLVTGHNLDDECQNILMNYLKGNLFLGARSAPKTGDAQSLIARGSKTKSSGDSDALHLRGLASPETCVTKVGFVQRVKPLFFVAESEIRKYAEKMKFDIMYERCPCAFGTYRVETREWMSNISDGEKMGIVSNWLKVKDSLVVDDVEMGSCEKCGEPSSGEVCNFCGIVSCL